MTRVGRRRDVPGLTLGHGCLDAAGDVGGQVLAAGLIHKIANVLGALPKSTHPGAKKALAEIWNAENRRHALDAVRAFEAAYGAKFPKAVAKITDDTGVLLAFYDFPAEHWIQLRTTDEIVNPLLSRAGFVFVGAVFPPFAAAA